jgi:tetratricopeptide (TPR) repeat protein
MWMRTNMKRGRVVFGALLGLSSACTAASRPPEHARAEARADQPHGPALLDVARVLAEHGDRVRAAQYLTLAQRQGVPERSVVPRLLALYAADGQYRLAIDAAENYLRRAPGDLKVRSCLAALYLAIDATGDAAHSYETLLRAEPNDAEAHFALASLLGDSAGSRARADQHYRSYLALEPAGRYADEARARLLKEVP